MTVTPLLAENLISCRNILLGGKTNEHVLPSLERTLTDLDLITVPSSRAIVGHGVAVVIDQVREGRFRSAGWILNLIHNLPLDEAGERRWDIDYFLSMELPAFLEHYDEVKDARSLVLYVCGEISAAAARAGLLMNSSLP